MNPIQRTRTAYQGAEGVLGDHRVSASWHTFRLAASLVSLIAGLTLGALWNWWGGVFTAGLALIPIADAIVTLRSGRSHPLRSILLDTTMVGAAMVIVCLEPVAVGAPFLYMVLVATLFLPVREALLGVAYGAAWSVLASIGVAAVAMPAAVSTAVINTIAYVIFAGHIVALLAVIARALEMSASAKSKALDELEAASKSKDQFLASISHEIRTPLTSVVGFSDLLNERSLDGESAEMAEMISREAHEVEYIVQDLLVAARADLGTIALHLAPTDLRDAVRASVGTLAKRAPRIRTDGSEPTALADPARVRQVLRVLLTNALRYGGPDVEVTISSGPDSVSVAVSDDGAAIPRGEVDRIFAPYHRAHRTHGQPQAIGLGLYVARHLARLMDGDLNHRRCADRTEFILTLPRCVGTLAFGGADRCDGVFFDGASESAKAALAV